MIEKILKEQDYDAGFLNDYGGGNVGWWMDYIRYEVGRCNDYWRSVIESYASNKPLKQMQESREPCKECGEKYFHKKTCSSSSYRTA